MLEDGQYTKPELGDTSLKTEPKPELDGSGATFEKDSGQVYELDTTHHAEMQGDLGGSEINGLAVHGCAPRPASEGGEVVLGCAPKPPSVAESDGAVMGCDMRPESAHSQIVLGCAPKPPSK